MTAPSALTPARLLRVALFLVLASVVASTKTDPDLWGHARFGIDMIHARSVSLPDTYSFTSDKPWLNHEWASEIAIGAAFLLGGNAGLFLLKLGVLAGVLLFLRRTLRRDGLVVAAHRDVALALAVIVTIEQAHNVRPQLFSLLFFAWLLSTLVSAARDRRVLFALPVLFALWANFHGGWIVGGAVVVLWTAGLLLGGRLERRQVSAHAAAGAAALAATLANPHGIELLAFLRTTVGFGRADIVEWQPVYLVGRNIFALWLAVAVLAAAGVVHSVRTRSSPGRPLVILALGIASLRVNRLLAFFGLATLFLYGAVLLSVLARRAAEARRPRPAAAIVAVVVSLILIAGSSRILAVHASCVAIDPRATPEAGGVQFFKAHAARGRLLVWFDWGEYALWHLAPGLLVSVDGRRETVYSSRVQDEHLRFYFDAPGGATLPRELGADYIWIPKTLPAVDRMLGDGWTAVYRGEQSVILSRVPLVPGPIADIGSAYDRRCFPGP